ncbi:MAG: hypothetical protein WBA99_19260 [Nodosilinea sp.]
MTTRSHLALTMLSILTTAAVAATAADARPGQGREQRPQPSGPAIEDVVPQGGSAALGVERPEISSETAEAEAQESLLLHGPVTQSAEHPQNLPPGLQRRVDNGRGLPPGLQRQVDSGRGLPPGLQNR